MTPQDRPKRRLVVYVTEEMYERLNLISTEECRSISNVAEKKIIESFERSSDRHSQARTGTARHDPAQSFTDDEKIKTSVLNTLSNLPDENLIFLAEKLQRILINNAHKQPEVCPVEAPRDYEPVDIPETHLPYAIDSARYGTIRHGTEGTSIGISKRDLYRVQGFVQKLCEFIRANKLTQRSFKQKYNLDITQLSRWERGMKYPSDETIQKFEKIMSGQET